MYVYNLSLVYRERYIYIYADQYPLPGGGPMLEGTIGGGGPMLPGGDDEKLPKKTGAIMPASSRMSAIISTGRSQAGKRTRPDRLRIIATRK